MDHDTKKKLRGKVVVLHRGPNRAARRAGLAIKYHGSRQFHTQSPAQVRAAMESKGIIKLVKK